VIKDSIEGWADAAHVLLCQYLHQGYYEDYDRITFDFSNIREKGAVISSGGRAPGAEPLKVALEKIDLLCARGSPRDIIACGRLTASTS
jgi:ribonucleoside-triphosphate reductase (thioredoxin)